MKQLIKIKAFKTVCPEIEHRKSLRGRRSPKAISHKGYKLFGYKWYR